MARKTTRLYYGLDPETNQPLYWTLKVKNATRSVVLKGTVAEAMTGEAGTSIGCHLSRVAQANKSCFPHPAKYVSFTRSVALVITKITNGQPRACIRYRHNYSRYVDLNDKRLTKDLAASHPEMFNRPFTLYPYKSQQPHWKPEYGRTETGERKAKAFAMARGELARLRDAGWIRAAL